MTLREKLIILCAPLIVLIEWGAFVFFTSSITLDFDEPLSALPYNHPSFSVLFGVLLTTIAILSSIFTLALRPYWKEVFRFSLVCGFFMALAGWTTYNPNGGFETVVHAGSANLSVILSCFIIFQIRQRSTGTLRQASRIFFNLTLLFMAATALAVNVFRTHGTWFQLLLVLTVQAWALYMAFYLWTKREAIP